VNHPHTRFRGAAAAVALAAALAGAAHAQGESSGSLTLGAIKQHAEAPVVRVLAKFGDSLAIADRLVPGSVSGDRGTFYTLNRIVKVDATDKGQFGGVSVRYGLKYYSVGMKTETFEGKPITKFDGDRLMHVVPLSFGVDADRDLQNRDYLVELGYIPALFRGTQTCFKLGANPIAGAALQVGRRTRSAEPTEAGKPAEPSGSLARLKVEAKADFLFSCVLGKPATEGPSATSPLAILLADIGQWQLSASVAAWRDFVENRNYRRTEINLRIPAGDKKFIDLKREIGAAPTDFNTGAKFSANLTVEF
jgi:hypothetical protein